MTEDNNVEINEILESVVDLDGDIEGSVSLWDLIAESVSEVVGDRIMNGNDWVKIPNDNPIGKLCLMKDNDDTPGEYTTLSRGSGKQARINEYNDEAFAQIEFGRRYVAEDMNSLASLMEHFSKSGQSVAEWVEATYGVLPITGDSLTEMTLSLTNKTEEPVRPRKRGERCSFCSNMKKKDLKKHDSCPSCGRSLFALKSRGW